MHSSWPFLGLSLVTLGIDLLRLRRKEAGIS